MTLPSESAEAPRPSATGQQSRRVVWLASVSLWLDRGQRLLLPVVLVACAELFRRSLDPKAPVRDWVFWRYPVYWALAAVWVLACSSAGFAVLRRVLRSPLPLLEHFTLCFAVGLLSFFWLMFVGGVLGLFGPVFFVGILLTLLASGAVPGLRYLRRLRRHLRAARARPRPTTPGAVLALWGLGLVALFLFYLPGIVPAQIGYDSAWYHVPLGEHYARLGRIAATPEGWYAATIPHLPAVVYAFGFLLPGGKLFDYIELSSHLEFAGTLMTLVGIPALVRRLVPRARAHVSWIALFAFPGLYWYDALIGGDQFSAVWAVPIALGLLRTFPELSWRHGLLLAAAIAGETLTKYSASGILIGPALAIGARICWLALRTLWQRQSLRVLWQRTSGGLFTGAAVLLLTTPLWLKNWIWYGDPFFPLLHQFFPKSHPWTQDASAFYADYQQEMTNWQPPPGPPGIKASLLQMATHAFEPADYSPLPFRGALFSMMCACLPFVRARARLWGIAIVCNLAVFGWYKQLHQDRYLMAFMPAMAAVLVSVAILAWRSSWVSRVLVFALFAFHTVFSLGVFALGNPNGHYRRVLEYAVAVANGSPDAGMGDLARWDAIGKTMPKGSKALVHGLHLHAGLGHPSVMDWQRTQTGLSYGRLRSPAAMYAELRRIGVTHMVYAGESWADDSYAGDLRFFELAELYSAPKTIGGYWVATLPQQPPPDFAQEPLIAFLGCDGRYGAGLYPFSAMTVPNPRRNAVPPYPAPLEALDERNAGALLARARYAVFKGDCGFARPPQLGSEFRTIGRRGDGYTLFVRKD